MQHRILNMQSDKMHLINAFGGGTIEASLTILRGVPLKWKATTLREI
jgi:hypothetical protein